MRPLEQRRSARGQFANRFAQLNIPDAPVGDASDRKIESLEPASLGKESMIDFRKVMIFGRQPENGYGIHSLLGQLSGHVHRGERLVNAVRRTAE